MVAQTRTGRQVLNVSGDVEAQTCVPAVGDTVAVIGSNRKLLIFGLSDLPEMTRGRGVILQRYRDGELSDIKVFDKADGLSWAGPSGRTSSETNLLDWQGQRGAAGRLAPRGFNRSNRFS